MTDEEGEVQEVKFTTQNRFEGRSNYFHYYPTDNIIEQKLESMWYEAQNRRLAEKRRDEETRHIMNEWSEARARMEAEIQRKKEHVNAATNFAKARGFVRSNWKSKNFNPKDDPTQYDSSTDESELAAREREEMGDNVEDMSDEYQSPKKSEPKKVAAEESPETQFFYDITE